MDDKKRCFWVPSSGRLQQYHDEEWGDPVYDDQQLYEILILESFTPGLSWSIILNKRENFREAFDGFNPNKIIDYDDKKIEELLQNTGIVRSASKLKATITNTKAFQSIQKEFGSFSEYIWGFTDKKVVKNVTDIFDAKNELAVRVATDFKKRGMKYLGPSITNAYLEAIGVINNHETTCFRYNEV